MRFTTIIYAAFYATMAAANPIENPAGDGVQAGPESPVPQLERDLGLELLERSSYYVSHQFRHANDFRQLYAYQGASLTHFPNVVRRRLM